MYLQNIVCVAPVLHSQIVRTNIVANIDTHTHKQTNTQGENIITSLTRVINIITSLTRVINMNTAVLHHLDSVFLIESQLNEAFNIDISTLCSMVPPYKRQRSVSTLDQVMDWCLTAPSHYLSQCWLFILCSVTFTIEQFHQKCSWRWSHNGHRGVSNHQPHDCLLNRLFRRRSMKTSNLRVTGHCAGNSPGPVNSPHKGPVTRKMFPFDDVIMKSLPHLLEANE